MRSFSAAYCDFRSMNSIPPFTDPSGKRRPQVDIAPRCADTCRTASPSSGRAKPFPMTAHPSDVPPRHADDEREIRNVAVDHGAGADERELADRDAAHDRAVGAERRAAPDDRVAVFALALDCAARVVDVGEHHARTAEDVVLERHVVVDGDVVLDLDVVADHDAVADEDVLAERAVAPDAGAAADVHPVPDSRAVADAAPRRRRSRSDARTPPSLSTRAAAARAGRRAPTGSTRSGSPATSSPSRPSVSGSAFAAQHANHVVVIERVAEAVDGGRLVARVLDLPASSSSGSANSQCWISLTATPPTRTVPFSPRIVIEPSDVLRVGQHRHVHRAERPGAPSTAITPVSSTSMLRASVAV